MQPNEFIFPFKCAGIVTGGISISLFCLLSAPAHQSVKGLFPVFCLGLDSPQTLILLSFSQRPFSGGNQELNLNSACFAAPNQTWLKLDFFLTV